MKSILKHLSVPYAQVRLGEIHSSDLPVLLLCAASAKLDPDYDLPDGLQEKWGRFATQPGFPHVQAAANALVRLSAPERLKAIAEIVSQSDLARTGWHWLDIEAASLIAELLGHSTSLRSTFSAAALPTICAALAAKEAGRAFNVRFIDTNRDICELVSLVAAVIEVEIAASTGDPFLRDDDRAATAELCMPPFLARISSPESLPQKTLDRLGLSEGARLTYEPVAIADALANAPDARVVIGCSSGALFRMVGVEAAARDEMVDSGRLATIFGVPSGMLYSNTQVTTGIVVLEPDPENDRDVRFLYLGDDNFSTRSSRGRYEVRPNVSWEQARNGRLDESSTWGRDVSRDEIKSQNNILTVERYLRNPSARTLSDFLEGHETQPLNEIVEVIRPRAVKKAPDGDYLIREASPGDIGETGYLELPPKETRLAKGALRGARNQRVEPGDVLLSVKGTIGRVGLVPEAAPDTEDGFWTAGQSLVILRSRNRIKPEVLYEYLTADVVQEHIRSLAGGSAIQSINAKDLGALEIPVPAMEEQECVVMAFKQRQTLYDEIDRIRDQISKERAATWPHGDLTSEDPE